MGSCTIFVPVVFYSWQEFLSTLLLPPVGHQPLTHRRISKKNCLCHNHNLEYKPLLATFTASYLRHKQAKHKPLRVNKGNLLPFTCLSCWRCWMRASRSETCCSIFCWELWETRKPAEPPISPSRFPGYGYWFLERHPLSFKSYCHNWLFLLTSLNIYELNHISDSETFLRWSSMQNTTHFSL